MSELNDRLRLVDRLQVPDMWADAQAKARFDETMGTAPKEAHEAAPDLRLDEDRRARRRTLTQRTSLKSRLMAGTVAAAVAVAGVGFVIVVFRPQTAPPVDRLPTSGDVTHIELGAIRNWSGGPVVAGDSFLWAVGAGADRPYELLRIDPVSLRVVDRISLGFADAGMEPTGLAVGDGWAWVSVAKAKDGRWDLVPGELLRVDEATSVVDRFSIPPAPNGIAYGDRFVWLAESSSSLARIDPSTGRVLDETPIGRFPRTIAPAFGSLWITDAFGEGSLLRVDPSTSTVLARFPGLATIGVGESAIWIEAQDTPSGVIQRIDPETGDVFETSIDGSIRPVSVSQGGGQTWVVGVEDQSASSSDAPVPPGDSVGPEVAIPIDPLTGVQLGEAIGLCPGVGQPVIAYGGLWFPCSSELLRVPLSPSADNVPTPMAEVARVACDDDTATVETPVVVAQPDGVHIRFENPGGWREFALHQETWGYGASEGGPLAQGVPTLDHSSIPPGQVTVACLPARGSYSDPGAVVATFDVVDPQGLYVPWDLACGDGDQFRTRVPGRDDETATDVFRRVEGVLPSDSLAAPLYPYSPTIWPTRIVVRNGEAVARIMAPRIGGGVWELLINSCRGSGISNAATRDASP
jgi:hypothetical protein